MTQDRDYKTRVVQEKQTVWLQSEIRAIQARRWFGTVTIVFDNGLMKRLKSEESKMPPQR